MNHPSITPDLAGKILRANLKNLIDKVSGGKTLTVHERSMFEKLRLDPDEIRARRQLSLVEKWSNGKRLSPEELREIGSVIPCPPSSDEAQPSENPPPMGPVFTLESPTIKSTPKWDEWSALYGSSPRTLKRWASHGKERGEDCPLGEPAKMPGWWQRHMRHRVPPEVMHAARGNQPENTLPSAAAADALPPEDTPENMEVSDAELGLEQTLARLARTEVLLSRKATDPGQAKPWLDTISRMTAVAERLRSEAERLGKLLPRAQVEEAIHAFHGPIEREIRLLYKTMCDALGLPPSPEKEALWNEEVDKLFGKFNEEVLR